MGTIYEREVQASFVMPDAVLDHWAALYLLQPEIARAGISFAEFLERPRFIHTWTRIYFANAVIASAGLTLRDFLEAPVALIRLSFADRLRHDRPGLLPAQRLVQLRADRFIFTRQLQRRHTRLLDQEHAECRNGTWIVPNRQRRHA